jgi:ATP-dependent Clp protease ATP-binding subunit ClpC
MFERYTEKARRVIFFARYEASQFGQPYIETEHILLGLLREDKVLANRFLRGRASVEEIRGEIEKHTPAREKTSTSVDLPLSNECKRVLAYAAEEAERLKHKHIGSEHLLLGLLREKGCFALELLKARGVKLEAVRNELASMAHDGGTVSFPKTIQSNDFFRDITQAAMDGVLETVTGRDQELNAVIEILCSRNKRSVVLVGERGVGRSIVVEALAQSIADGDAPDFLTEKRILAYDPPIAPRLAGIGEKAEERAAVIVAGLGRERRVEQLGSVVQSLAESGDAIFFLGDLASLWGAGTSSVTSGVGGIIRSALVWNQLQCIGVSTPTEWAAMSAAHPWLGECFRPIHLREMDEVDSLTLLQARKRSLEKFHEVNYTDEAIEYAVGKSGQVLSETPLPARALEVLDAAGARVKLRRNALPDEVVEIVKRIKFIEQRMTSSIANHEFEKARFYSEEERKERTNLRAVKERLQVDDTPSTVVGREDVEEVISRWAEYPFRP